MNEKRSALRHEIFYPYILVSSKNWEEEKEELPKIMGFTEGKEYPIFEEKIDYGTPVTNFGGIRYKTIDDEGRDRLVPCHYFTQKIVMGTKYLEDDPIWSGIIFEKQPETFCDIRLTAAKMQETGKPLYWSGLPEIIFNYNKLVVEARAFCALAGLEDFAPAAEIKHLTEKHVREAVKHLEALQRIVSEQLARLGNMYGKEERELDEGN